MAKIEHCDSEAGFEQFLGNLLRVGVLSATVVVLLGAVLYLVRHGEEQAKHKAFPDEAGQWRGIKRIFAEGEDLSGAGVIQLGLLLLVATPVARVVFSVIGFLREGDYTYVVLTLIVLAVLLFSLFFGALF